VAGIIAVCVIVAIGVSALIAILLWMRWGRRKQSINRDMPDSSFLPVPPKAKMVPKSPRLPAHELEGQQGRIEIDGIERMEIGGKEVAFAFLGIRGNAADSGTVTMPTPRTDALETRFFIHGFMWGSQRKKRNA
jgi:hypothetical protein